MILEISNLTNEKISKKDLEIVIKKVLEILKIKYQKTAIDLTVVGLKRMRHLNFKFRKKNKATDVLSFKSSKEFILPETDLKYLGEIIICYEIAKKQAKEFKTSLEKELERLLIHGLLHLLGYDHEKSQAQAQKMENKEKQILRFLSR